MFRLLHDYEVCKRGVGLMFALRRLDDVVEVVPAVAPDDVLANIRQYGLRTLRK